MTDPVGPSRKVNILEEMQVRTPDELASGVCLSVEKCQSIILEKLLLYPSVLMMTFVGADPGVRSFAALRI